MTYTIYEIVAKGLLLNRKGVPYKSFRHVVLWARNNGLTRVPDGKRDTYAVPEKVVKDHNERIKKLLVLTDKL